MHFDFCAFSLVLAGGAFAGLTLGLMGEHVLFWAQSRPY